MLYFKKGISKKDRESWRRWVEKKQREISAYERSLPPREIRAQQYWDKQKKLSDLLSSTRVSVAHLPSGSAPEQVDRGPDLSHLTEEQLIELRAREEEAQRIAEKRKGQVAPLYNKSGYFYLGDPELIKSVAVGTNRRR